MRHVTTTSALKPLHALIRDVCRDRPELTEPLLKDYQSIKRMVETRGLPVLLEQLPSLGKAFDKGLSSGWFREPAGIGTLRNQTIKFRSLITECFDTTGKLRGVLDPNTVLYVRQLCYMYKKLKVECPPENIKATVEEFVHLDQTLRMPSRDIWNGILDEPTFPHGERGHRDSLSDAIDSTPFFGEFTGVRVQLMDLLQRVSDIVISTMPEPTWEDLVPRHGPGAVADLRKDVSKYDFPYWPEKLQARFPKEFFTNSEGDLRTQFNNHISDDEVPGRLLAVPKTYSKPRLITAEPTANQFCQQAVLGYLRKYFPKVLSRSVDFFDQQPSQEAALEASTGNGFATVDLSSASDLLSCWTVERMLRTQPQLLHLLAAARTRFVTDDTGSDCFKYLRLRKFAGQGSAVTFPIQTLIYTIIAITAVIGAEKGLGGAHKRRITLKMIRKASRKVRVFGDDIVIPEGLSLWYLETMMRDLQLKVNLDKTHFEGLFRESCGMDAYHGFEVTPVYLSAASPEDGAESLQSWIDVSNLFHRKGYWHLSTWMLEELDDKVRRLVPISRNSDDYALALHTFSDGYCFNGLRRFDKHLHSETGKILVSRTREKRVQGGSRNNMLQYFLECKPCHPDSLGSPTFARWTHGHVTRKSFILKKDWVVLR